MADSKISVFAKSENQTRTVVEAGGFRVTIDEPESFGGTNMGANPLEIELAALAGCLNVVGHLVAKEMKIELEGMRVNLEGNFNPAGFMGKQSPDRAGYKEILVSITVETDADDETMKEWVRKIEERCPVSDNLKNPTPITISFNR